MKKRLPTTIQSLLLELIVVFIGVYLAFALNNYSENQKVHSEKDKIMSSLKHELDVIGISFAGMGAFQEAKANEWDSLLAIDQIGNYYTWRYIQPQYNYAVLEYAINTRDSRIIDFELYEKLIQIHREIKKLEFTENQMTEWGGKLSNVPQGLDSTHLEHKIRTADNRFSFYKFTDYAHARADIIQRLPELSREALQIINPHFNAATRLQQEKKVLSSFAGNIQIIKNEERWAALQAAASQHFTHITDEEWQQFRKELLLQLESQ